MPSEFTRGAKARAGRIAVGASLTVAGVVALALPASAATPGGAVTTGNDISFPQSASTFPSGQAFGIVGVNGGLAETLNPCFGADPSYTDSELYWAVSSSTGAANQPKASLYVNTGDPGNVANNQPVTDWPSSGNTPYGACTTTTVTIGSTGDLVGADSTACAWMYGAQAANEAASWLASEAASDNNGSPPVSVPTGPGAYPWWLDVETGNSWQGGSAGQAMNVAVLQGMVAALQAAGATTIGIYW